MFAALGNLFSRTTRNDYPRVLLLGISGAGKTTLLYHHLKGQPDAQFTFTMGFNVEDVMINGLPMTVWDVGGGYKIPPLWKHYAQACTGVIFVVDSTDRLAITEARENLHLLLTSEELEALPLVVMANKQDREDTMDVDEIITKLDLRSIPRWHWHIQICSFKTGEGVRGGTTWFANAVYKQINSEEREKRIMIDRELGVAKNELTDDEKLDSHIPKSG